jgi:hypothetical protein
MNKQAMLREAMLSQSDGEFEGQVVSDTSEVPKGYQGQVLHINDHGNVTLYRAFKNGNLHEIASCV